MKNNYYKLNLKNIYFWETNGIDRDIYFVKYRPCKLDELNHLYFKKVDENTYVENITSNTLIVKDGSIISPSSVSIPINNLKPCEAREVLYSFEK